MNHIPFDYYSPDDEDLTDIDNYDTITNPFDEEEYGDAEELDWGWGMMGGEA